MLAVLQCRRWLFYSALGMPAVLLPRFDYMGPTRVRYSLGWPFSGMDLLIALQEGSLLHFQPSPLLLLFVGIGAYLASLGWRARRWAVMTPDWRGAFVQPVLTSLYCALLFCFLHGTVQAIWDWQVHLMDWPALERAATFGRAALPYLYGSGSALISLVLFLDSRLRPGYQRLVYVAFALSFVLLSWRLSPYLSSQLAAFDEMIQYARNQQR